MIVPELARENHGARAFYFFGKAMTKLCQVIKSCGTILNKCLRSITLLSLNSFESMNLDKHSGRESRVERIGNANEDYVLMGKVGKGADSLSRLFSYATAYTHYTDLGFAKQCSKMELVF